MTLSFVQVVAYRSDWTRQYQREALALERLTCPALVRLEHIGSTAVKGLAAKPIIDMLMEVTSLDALDAVAARLELRGYQARGEFGIAGRRYFTLGEAPRTYNLHCFASGDAHLIRHRAFRDYLACHPEVVAEYGALKLGLAERYASDIEAYMDGKDFFIKRHEEQALAWAQRRHISSG
jgi:GrpB-like predicted nucleotidyltransferase (UPF0157 family)